MLEENITVIGEMVYEMRKHRRYYGLDASHSRIRTLDNSPFIERLKVMH